MASARLRAPVGGPMRQGPAGRRRTRRPAGMTAIRPAFRRNRPRRRRFAGRRDRRPKRVPARPFLWRRNRAHARRGAAAEGIVLEQAQALHHARGQGFVLFAEDVHHHAEAEARAGGHAFEGARIGLGGNAVDGVLALHFRELVVEVLAHLRRDALQHERRIVDGQARGGGGGGLERLAGSAFHAAGAASEQEADFVVGAVALMNANFLAASARQVHQLGRHCEAERLFQQRAQASAQGAAGNIGEPEGILDDGIVGPADLEGAFAGADMQAGAAFQLSFENQLSDQFQFGLFRVRTHGVGQGVLFVVGDDGFKQFAEAFVAAGVVLARDLEQQFLKGVEAAQAVARDGVSEAGAQHDELVLALVFRRADGAADGVVQAAQLAAGSGIHVAHPADHGVRLVIQVQRVAHQLVEIDFGRAFGTAPVAAIAARPPVVAPISAFALAARATIAAAAILAAWAALARAAVAPLAFTTRRTTTARSALLLFAWGALLLLLLLSRPVSRRLRAGRRGGKRRGGRLGGRGGCACFLRCGFLIGVCHGMPLFGAGRFGTGRGCTVWSSVSRRAHSRATRPLGRILMLAALPLARSAARPARAF